MRGLWIERAEDGRVRLHTSPKSHFTLTPDQARLLAARLVCAADKDADSLVEGAREIVDLGRDLVSPLKKLGAIFGGGGGI